MQEKLEQGGSTRKLNFRILQPLCQTVFSKEARKLEIFSGLEGFFFLFNVINLVIVVTRDARRPRGISITKGCVKPPVS